MKSNAAIWALAIGAFGIGVTEFAPMGLLPAIAVDLGVSIPSAGLLIGAYAAGVMLGAPLVTLTTRHVPRRTLLVSLMLVFTIGNLLSALPTGYGMLMAARIVTSLCHGAFFGVGAIVASGLVAHERRAAAVAAMFMGLTAATIVGVPLATLGGEIVGWRAAFWAMALLGIAAMVALRLTLPALPVTAGRDLAGEFKVLCRGPVLAALTLTVVSSTAWFTVFTYITPILQTETRLSIPQITGMLVLFGAGTTVGNWLGGKYADRSVDRTLGVTLACMSVLLTAFAFAMPHALLSAPLIFFWGMTSFAIVAPLQMRVMSAAADAPHLSSAINIGAFNLGNALGALIGGAVIGWEFGYPAVAASGAALAALGLMLVIFWGRNRASRSGLARPTP